MSHGDSSDVFRPDAANAGSTVAWFCLRSQPKHEHIAASHLRQMEEIEVFNPRVRFARATRQGPVWVTEALFPNYLFAKFDWKTSLARVRYAPGVSNVVHFGSKWPTLSDQVINELRDMIGQDEVHIVPKEFAPGDKIKVAGGIFHGLEAVITQVMPGRQRVMILMDFLGRQSTVEVFVKDIVKDTLHR